MSDGLVALNHSIHYPRILGQQNVRGFGGQPGHYVAERTEIQELGLKPRLGG